MLDLGVMRRFILGLQDAAVPAQAAALGNANFPYLQILKRERIVDVLDDSHQGEAPHEVIALTAVGQILSERLRDEGMWKDTLTQMEGEASPMTVAELKRRLLTDQDRERASRAHRSS